jgi:biopolymer transport protein ExbD
MALKPFSEDERPIAVINIIPFVDIVLVLLIIFMLTSTAIVRSALKVELPKAATGGDEVTATLNLIYTKEGELFLNGARTTESAVIATIKEELSKNPKLQAVIAADKGVAYGDVVGLIDLVKENGVHAFALNIEKGARPTRMQ